MKITIVIIVRDGYSLIFLLVTVIYKFQSNHHLRVHSVYILRDFFFLSSQSFIWPINNYHYKAKEIEKDSIIKQRITVVIIPLLE